MMTPNEARIREGLPPLSTDEQHEQVPLTRPTSHQVLFALIWNLIIGGQFALQYWISRTLFDADQAWAAGYACVLAVVLIVGVPKR